MRVSTYGKSIRHTQFYGFYLVPVILKIHKGIMLVSSIHFLGHSTCLFCFTPSRFNVLSISLTCPPCKIQGPAVLAIIFMSLNMQLWNKKPDPVSNIRENRKGFFEALLEFDAELTCNIICQDNRLILDCAFDSSCNSMICIAKSNSCEHIKSLYTIVVTYFSPSCVLAMAPSWKMQCRAQVTATIPETRHPQNFCLFCALWAFNFAHVDF